MDEGLLQIAIFLGGGFFLIISGLLTWIGVMQKETKAVITKKNDEQDERLTKHDEKFDKVHQEIHNIQLQNAETLTLMKVKLKIK